MRLERTRHLLYSKVGEFGDPAPAWGGVGDHIGGDSLEGTWGLQAPLIFYLKKKEGENSSVLITLLSSVFLNQFWINA